MKNEKKTKEQMKSELAELRQHIAELETAEAERKKAEERIEHLTLVLRAIRNVNQLITKEKDRDKLLKGTCRSLIETRGYHGAWIVLLDDSGKYITGAQAGLGRSFTSFVITLKQGEVPICVKKALKKSEAVVVKDPLSTCSDCPLVEKYAGRSSMAIRLEYEGRIYGVLTVSFPADLVMDEEERSLFTEVADDIAFALHNIEMEDERRRMEEELRDSEVRFRGVFESKLIGTLFWDANGDITDANDAFLQMVGYTRDDIHSGAMRWRDMTPPEFKHLDDKALEEIATLGAMTPIEKEYIRKDGSRIPILLGAASLPGPALNGVAFVVDITDKKKAEVALRESEEKYYQIISTSTDTIMVFDAKTKDVVEINKAGEDLYGYSREEFFHMNILDITSEEKETGEAFKKVLKGKLDHVPVRYHKKKDGTVFPVEISASQFEFGDRTFVCGLVRDITDKKKAEEERERLLMQVEQERDKLQVLIDSITDEVWFADTKGRFTIANPSALREFGIDTDDEVEVEELAKSLEVLRPDGSPRPVEEAPPLRALSGELVRCQEEIVRTPASGELRYRQVSSAPVRDSTGSIIGAVSVVRDITEHKQAEKRFEKVSTATESVLNDILLGEEDEAETERRILDACLTATDSPYGMVGKINDGGNYDTTTYAGEAMEDCAFPEALAWDLSTGMPIRGIWGWPMLHGEALICNDLETHTDKVGFPEGHAPIKCFLGAPLKRDGKVVGMVAVANRPGGYSEEDKYTLVKLASVISVSRRHREALDEVTKTSTDLERLVIELREAQEQLIRREKLAVLGQLAGGVGHELRNPLGAIKNAAYFLNMAVEEPEPEVKETLEIIEKEVATSERIISSLLGFARTKSPTLRKVDVNDVVQVALSRADVPENVEIVSELGEALPVILADPDQLDPVLDNLILNAIQAMPEGGRLTVGSETPDPEWVTVSVTDTGVGIPEENLKKLYEPLFTTKAKGIGLGLPVSRTLIEEHGGTIEVESKEGEGSTFTVRLPVGGGEEK